MNETAATIRRVVLLTALYLAGAMISVLFLRTPADVTLFWPAAGLGFAVVMHYGLRYAFTIAIGQALLHWLMVPVSLVFLPFSVGSNAVATAIAVMYVHSRRRGLQLRTEDGLLLLRGALLMCVISGAIGSTGMVMAGMVPATEWARAYLQWSLGDLLGASTTTPGILLILSVLRYRHLPPDLGTSCLRERVSWCVLTLFTLVLALIIANRGSLYPLSIVSLPLALLLWSAVRFPAAMTVMATMIVGVTLAIILGLGLDGVPRPETLQDTTLLMTSLVVISTIPILMAASYRERREAMAALHVRATRDPLTGLYNRDAFEEQARVQLSDPVATQTLLYVDLDNFKLVNDSASHAAGDEILRHVARHVLSEFEGALVAHGGGDEFLLLAPMDADNAMICGRRLLASIEAMRVAWQGSNLRVTASIGLASSAPPHANFDDLLSQADTACQAAKELGGNRLLAVGQDPNSLRTRNRMMRSALDARNALDQRRFELWAQPIIDLHATPNPQAHFEVLLRWRDDEGQLRPPANLIAAAERFQLGPRLDRYVLTNVLTWADSHPTVISRIKQCNVNLGAATLVDEDFADFVTTRLRRSALRPQQICFEITETSVVRDMNKTRRFIHRMHELGCRFALDDFGTGFCSFSYLRDLNVDYLKIDGSFVRDLEHTPLAEAVVRSITEIAHLLGMRAVAEHVETEHQVQQLRALHVDYAQGYIFQRPTPMAEFFNNTPQDVPVT